MNFIPRFCFIGMDGQSSEACSELGTAKLVANWVLTQNAYQTAFVSRQKRQDSN